MKFAKPSKTETVAAVPQAEPAQPAQPAQEPSQADLDLKERRKFIRPLPSPEAVESNGDSDWAAFNALIAEK